jgi:hypothetical protein
MTEDVLSWRKIDECALFCNLITPLGDSWADLGLGTYLFMRLMHVLGHMEIPSISMVTY